MELGLAMTAGVAPTLSPLVPATTVNVSPGVTGIPFE
jgi:hypothetical protein